MIRHRLWAITLTAVVAASATFVVDGAANAAVPTGPTGTPLALPTFNLEISAPALNGTGRTVTRKATATLRPGVDPARVANSASAGGTCTLSGAYPSLVEAADMKAKAFFSGGTWCDFPGTVVLTVAIQQAVPGGGYATEGLEGPERGTIVILGVRTLAKFCFELSLGSWRGLAHPMVETEFYTIDWGWFWTAPDTPLSC